MEICATVSKSQSIQGEVYKGGNGGSDYVLPVATPDVLGGVMPVAKTDAMTQSVGVDEVGRLWTVPGDKWVFLGEETVTVSHEFEPIAISNGVITLDPSAVNYDKISGTGVTHCALVWRDPTTAPVSNACLNCSISPVDYSAGTFNLTNGDGIALTTAYDPTKYKIVLKTITAVSIPGIAQYKQYRMEFTAPYMCSHGARGIFYCNIAALGWNLNDVTIDNGQGVRYICTTEAYGHGAEYAYVHVQRITSRTYGANSSGSKESILTVPASAVVVPQNGVVTFTLRTGIFGLGARFRLWGANT